MSDGRSGPRCRDGHIAAPAWAGLLSSQERDRLDTVARQWAGPGLTTACLQAVVEAALGDAVATYDRATGSDFLVHAMLALRVGVRRSGRGRRSPST